ncbi:MAG: MerR family transcriptional regulator [Polyangiaceae bacterium]|nr:MerR family transcriptional regulator [Polyangiaceae bacterium]
MVQGTAELHKLYYRIGEVAGIVGVEPHVLRYWETEFRSIRPQKSRKGHRIYSRRDVEKLMRVKDLLYVQGFTIAGARKRLRDLGTDPSHAVEPLGSLAASSGTPGPALSVGIVAAEATAALRFVQAERSVEALRGALAEIRGEVAAFLDELEGDAEAE